MRYAFLFLVCLAVAAADSFTLYSGNNFTFNNTNFTVSLFAGDDPNLAPLASAIVAAKQNDDQAAIDAAQTALNDELTKAKLNDLVAIRSEQGGTILGYKDCKWLLGVQYCFSSITYLEEDTALSSVKIVNGTIMLPFVITTSTTGTADVQAVRTFSPSQPYTNDRVTVSVAFTNTGSDVAGRVTDQETSPLPVISGDTSYTAATINPGDTKQFTYVIQPKAGGNYTFSGQLSGTAVVDLPDSVLEVQNPLAIGLNTTDTAVATETPFSVQLTNVYTSNLVADLTLSSNDVFNSFNGLHRSGSSLTLSGISIPAGTSVSYNGTLLPQTAGTGSLSAKLQTRGLNIFSAQGVVTYTVLARDLYINTTTDNLSATFTITNTGDDASDVLFDFGESAKYRIPLLRNGVTTSFTHVFTDNGSRAVNLTYTVGQDHREKDIPVRLSGITPILPPAQVNETEQNTPPPAEVTPPTEAPPTQPEPIVQQKADTRPFLKKVLDWISHLFG